MMEKLELIMDYDYQYLLFYDTLSHYCKNSALHLKQENSLQLSILQDNKTKQFRMTIDALHSTCVNEIFIDYLATLFCFHDTLLGDDDKLAKTELVYDYFFTPRTIEIENIKTYKKTNTIFKPLKKIINNDFCTKFIHEAKLDAIHNFFDCKGQFEEFKLYQKFFFFEGYEAHLNDIFNLDKIKSIEEKKLLDNGLSNINKKIKFKNVKQKI